MIESRLDRIEEMLSTLISKVGAIHSNQQTTDQRLQNMDEKFENRLQSMDEKFENRLQSMEEKFENRFQKLEDNFEVFEKNQNAFRKETESKFNEVNKKLDTLIADQDFIWEKTARNEREIAKLKNQLS
jgi:hypothetical protein